MLRKVTGVILFLLTAGVWAKGQVAAPTGSVSVRLARPVDTTTMRAGQALPAVVVSSTGGQVDQGSGAAVQLVANQQGLFMLQLVRLAVGGQMFATTSSSPTLPNGSPAVGRTLSIPANTVVTFTLGQSTARGSAVAPRAPAAPKHPSKDTVDLAPAADGYRPIHASAPIGQDNCWWTPFVSQKWGFEAAVQKCADRKLTSVVLDTETGLAWQLLEGTPPNTPTPFVTVLTKPADQPIEAAIKAQLIAKLKDPAARTNCKVVKGFNNGTPGDTGVSNSNPDIQFYTVAATGPYGKLRKFTKEDATEEACPGLTSNDAISVFFQYNPAESKTTFFYFQEDDNGSVFNNESVHFKK